MSVLIGKTKVSRWGNSLAVRIPKAVAGNLAEGDELQIALLEDGRIALEPHPSYTLDELLDGMEPQEELDWGPRQGNEIW